MFVAADTHVHLYPQYDLKAGLSAANRKLNELFPSSGKSITKMLFLTDRAKFPSAFELLMENEKSLSPLTLRKEAGTLAVRFSNGDELWLIPGKQIVTSERIEVLSLACDASISDGHSLSDTIAKVLESGGTPVLPWSAGKWWFARGKKVDEALERSAATDVLLGDIYMRPNVVPDPIVFKKFRAAGFRVIAGSDPLPCAGEEQFIGSYSSGAEVGANGGPLELARNFLRAPLFDTRGTRSSVGTFLSRMRSAKGAPAQEEK